MALLVPPDNPKDESAWLSYFELAHENIESGVSSSHLKNEESYVGHGLSAEALYTSFADYHQMLTHPLMAPGDTLIDVGAGICKGALLAKALKLPVEVISLELVSERVEAAREALLKKELNPAGLIECDLLSETLPKAKHYFLYLPTGILLSKILLELRDYARDSDFYVWCIESHGDLVPTLNQLAPWLELIDDRVELHSLRHDPHLYIFKSSRREIYESENFPKQNEICELLKAGCDLAGLVIRDRDLGATSDYLWLADLKGLSMGVRPQFLQAHYPDREFSWDQVESTLETPSDEFLYWVRARREERYFPKLGQVRKIILSPMPTIEFSIAGRVPLSEANKCRD